MKVATYSNVLSFHEKKMQLFIFFTTVSRDGDLLRSTGKVFQVIIAEYKNEVCDEPI